MAVDVVQRFGLQVAADVVAGHFEHIEFFEQQNAVVFVSVVSVGSIWVLHTGPAAEPGCLGPVEPFVWAARFPLEPVEGELQFGGAEVAVRVGYERQVDEVDLRQSHSGVFQPVEQQELLELLDGSGKLGVDDDLELAVVADGVLGVLGLLDKFERDELLLCEAAQKLLLVEFILEEHGLVLLDLIPSLIDLLLVSLAPLEQLMRGVVVVEAQFLAVVQLGQRELALQHYLLLGVYPFGQPACAFYGRYRAPLELEGSKVQQQVHGFGYDLQSWVVAH